MKKTKLLLVVMILALCLVVAAGCTSTDTPPADPDPGTTAPPDAGTEDQPQTSDVEQKLRLPLKSIPTIDNQQFNASPSYVAIKGISEGLIRTHEGSINPGVAESWEVADDNMSMTFHLRQDACWSDGSPLTANDFVYSFRRLADPANAYSYSWVLYEIANYPEVEAGELPVEDLGILAPDDHTVVINFHTPAPYYLSFLDMPPFHPTKQEWVEQYGDNYASSADTHLGNGPFKVTDYMIDQRLVMVPNENYWNKDAIKLEEVTISVMDEETSFAMFESGALDYSNIPVAVASNYLQDPSLLPAGSTAQTFMSGAVDWFCINIASTDKPFLGNKDFRLALNYALDREEYIAVSSGGLYSPATRFVLPAVSGENGYYADEYPINVFQTTAEVDKAKQHLQAAMDAEGISDPSEISFSITIADTTPKLIAENCQDQWMRNLGINVTIDTVTYPLMLSNRTDSKFDLIYAGWMPDYDDPYTYLGYFVSTNRQNGGKFSSERYDELVNTANNYPDAATRLSMYAEAETILMEEAGIVPLQVREVPWAKKDNLQGLVRFYLGSEDDYTYAYFE